MKTRLMVMLAVICVVSAAACMVGYKYSAIYRLPLEKRHIMIEGKDFQVFVAQNDPERAQGLQNIAWMPDNVGMLFIFPEEDAYCFWNKNTLMDLDLFFMRHGKVVEKIRLPSIRHGKITICPKEAVDWVVETVAR